MKSRAFLVSALALSFALALCLAGCGSVGGKTDAGDGYRIDNQKLVKKGDAAFVSGTITNKGDAQHTILVEWYAYDSGKNGIGTATFNANMIKPGETYDFEQEFLDTGGKSIRYDSVKEFLLGEARFTDVERQEYLDSLGQSEKGDGFSLKNEEITVTNGHEFSISGKITNETDRDCKYSLNWDVKDKSGTKIAEVFMTEPGNQMYLASVEVKAGETVSFSASGGGPVNTGVVRNTYTPDTVTFTLNQAKCHVTKK